MNLTLSISNATNTVKNYLSESKVAIVFLVIISIIFVLNLAKRIMTIVYSKTENKGKKCRFLITGEAIAKCDHPSHVERFIANNSSCNHCKGKMVSLTKEELELKASQVSRIHHYVFLIANYGKSLLPYISFIFTLIVAAYVTKKS